MIAAAIELLNSAGLNGTTLVAIGEKAGYSRGLASHHFGTKAELFRAVLKKLTAIWTAELVERLEGRSGLDALLTSIDAFLDHALRHPKYIRAQNILWGAALDPSSEFNPNVAEFMRIQRESVANWIRDGQAEGEIRPNLDPDRLAEQFYGGLIGICSQWLVSPDFDLASAYNDFKFSITQLISETSPKRNSQ